VNSLDEILERADRAGPCRVAVAGAEDPEVLRAVQEAQRRGWGSALLAGDARRVRRAAEQLGLSLADHEVLDCGGPAEAAARAVSEVRHGRAQILLKGSVETSVLLRAVLDKDRGLSVLRPLSHVAVMQVPSYPKLLLLTDGGVNIAPDLERKAEIVRNAVSVAHALGIARPTVAALAAVERVDPKMPATVDAAALAVMSRRGQLGNCVVEGPVAFDLAISPSHWLKKGMEPPFDEPVDIIVVPDIEVGNALGKSLMLVGRAQTAGIVVGTREPVVLLSRADPSINKLRCIGLGMLMRQRLGDQDA